MSVHQLAKSEENNNNLLFIVCEGKNLFSPFVYIYTNILLHKLAKGYAEYTNYLLVRRIRKFCLTQSFFVFQADIRSREYLRQHYMEELKSCSCKKDTTINNKISKVETDQQGNGESHLEELQQSVDDINLE